ncbi:MAG: helix-hairpin-helix domain-containing protein [Candidatus Latescibacteria bacterium]|nr:helix-hairpin-helix domain-containing protein [Candidatus Latescibacterota bacterium]
MIRYGFFAFLFVLILSFFISSLSQAEVSLPTEAFLDPEGDYSELLADLEVNPVDLNRAGVSDLLAIPWLSEKEAQAIVNFRRKQGPFKSKDELSRIKALDRELIESLRPYVIVHRPLPLTLKERLRVKQKGRLQGEQLPHSLTLYQRLSLSVADRYELGLLVEKDSGERDLADFMTGYLQVEQIAGIDQVVAGDFRPGFAQGLVFSRWSYSISDPRLLKKKDSSSVGYRSSVENGALRGIFLRKSFQTTQWAIFFSQSRLDASLNKDGTVKTLLTSGYHITASEKAKKNLLSEKLTGGRFLYAARKNLKLGASFALSSFNPAFKNYDLERKRYAFTGSNNSIWGIDWDIVWPRLNLYGEAALCKNGGKAILGGATSKIRGLKVSALARSYSRDFHSFHGSAFSAAGKLYNETGLFASLVCSPTESIDLLFYVDQYHHPYRRYYEPVPTRGDKWGLVAAHEFSRQVDLLLDLRSKYNQRGKEALGRRNNRIRLNTCWSPDKRWRLRSRAEIVFLNFEDSRREQGISAFWDFRIRPFRSSTICGRLTTFKTDSYDSRIYEFETDHPGAAFSRFIYGKGVKWYLFVAQKMSWGRLSAKYRWQKTQKGRKCEFSLQLDLQIK